MFKAETVNKYSIFVCSFSVVAIVLSLLAFFDNLAEYMYPVVKDDKEFTYEIVKSEKFLSSLLLPTREKYFENIKEEDFEDEKIFLLKIYQNEIKQKRPQNALQTLVYVILFALVFNMHRNLVKNTGGWKKRD